MIEGYVFKLMQSFPRSFMNQHGEFIAHEKANEYFNLVDCKDELDVKCKALEWLSRGASKGVPYRKDKQNAEFQTFMREGINTFLGTSFTAEEMSIIYQELGNRVNHNLSVEFVNCGFDMNLLT